MKKGFTLIELMIVVAILAILTAIAIPQYQKHKDPQAYANREAIRMRKEFYNNVIIDPQTNCQYIKSSDGSLVPRRDASGAQVCN